MLVLGFSDYDAPAKRLAAALDAEYAVAHVHRFPDGESGVRLSATVATHVVLCRSLNDPNSKLIELMLAASAARRHGAQRLTLVAPYLCYLRQDAEFEPGDAVSAPVIGRFLASHFDEVITVDPHLHRISQLADAVPTARALSVTAAPMLAEFLATKLNNPVLLGPDQESSQWVASMAAAGGWRWAVATKIRRGDRQVELHLPPIDLRGCEVVLVDDVISTGRTLLLAVNEVMARGAKAAYVMVTHPLFAEHVELSLRQAGAQAIWSSDSIVHASNVVCLAPLLSGAVKGGGARPGGVC